MARILEKLFRRLRPDPGVPHAVTRNLVTARDNLADDVRIMLCHPAQGEKRGFGPMLIEACKCPFDICRDASRYQKAQFSRIAARTPYLSIPDALIVRDPHFPQC